MTCERCGAELVIGSYPFCHGNPADHARQINGAIGDECDIMQENGFRHPTRFTSKRELARALAERGLEMQVKHVTVPGTDKSPYTTDWSKGSMDAQTLENARILAERQAHTRVRQSRDAGAIAVAWAPVKSGLFTGSGVQEVE